MKARRFFATFFGLGHVPLAPGTAGSAGACALWLAVLGLPWARLVTALLAAGSTIGAFFLARYARCDFGGDDPKQFVIDEVAGFYVGALLVPLSVPAALLLFVLFRFFDVLKPFPIKRLERVGSSAGVVLDDLAAGLAAGLLTLAVARFSPGILQGVQ